MNDKHYYRVNSQSDIKITLVTLRWCVHFSWYSQSTGHNQRAGHWSTVVQNLSVIICLVLDCVWVVLPRWRLVSFSPSFYNVPLFTNAVCLYSSAKMNRGDECCADVNDSCSSILFTQVEHDEDDDDIDKFRVFHQNSHTRAIPSFTL